MKLGETGNTKQMESNFSKNGDVHVSDVRCETLKYETKGHNVP